MTSTPNCDAAFELASEQYASIGVNVKAALSMLSNIAVSVHCWQGDDVVGFESDARALGDGLAVTGNYPGRARNADELRSDLRLAYSLIPGKHRLNLHALYGDFETPTDRDEIEVSHFQGWIDWARDQQISLDFNPSFFSHRNASDGFTLAHSDPGIRQFWIDHGIACRKIAAAMGADQGNPCINNFWVPDGYKDTPANRRQPRERLADSLDAVFAEPLASDYTLDAVECKLFGIGSESYVVGSHEFYMGYAMSRDKVLCLDAGHFHPTEVISDKISSVLMYLPQILLHVSRGVRWDSDHVVTYTDELQAIMQEIVRGGYLQRVNIGLDFFDASINRVAAWVIGTRNVLKALLAALLEPVDLLQKAEAEGDYTTRLALMEEQKTMPLGAVWDYYCESTGVPSGSQWLSNVRHYENSILADRSDIAPSII
ncbi:L-rhamnose isomerase [Crateriforma spongiae]|uniref:L-rhamnose isomerase n=1 Tax=Crateriforma spongiae TaxID=2724528 RepID=UPI0014480F3E|nr:L-rhamnose isomerase [Crateriforma spongiae]